MKRVFFVILVCCFCLAATDAVAFDAQLRVDRTRIPENGSVSAAVIVHGGEGEVDTAGIKDFRVIPRGSSTNVSIVNGTYAKKVTYRFVMVPLKKGTLTIPPLKVTGEGEAAFTKEVTIEVSDRTDRGDGPADFFARAAISDTTLFAGQEAVYTFRLYSAAGFSDARLARPPFESFSVTEVPDRQSYTETVNGRRYEVREINYLVVPQEAGEIDIPPAYVMLEVLIDEDGASGAGSFFNDDVFSDRFFSRHRTQTRKVATGPVRVSVSPLPAYEGDNAFSGVIGEMRLEAWVDKKNLAVGESATLTVTVSGRGNIMDSSIGSYELPGNCFKVYDDAPVKEIELTPAGHRGKKTFKKAVVPVKAGDFTLPGIRLDYFDVTAGTYRTAAAPDMDIHVIPAPGQEPAGTGAVEKTASLPEKRRVAFTGRDILPLKQGPDVLKPQFEISFYLFLAIVILPGVLFLVLRSFLLFCKRPRPPAEVMTERAEKALKSAEKGDLSGEEFLGHLYTAVLSKIFAKADTTGQSLTRAEAFDMLNGAGVAGDKAEQFLRLFDDIESARYGGRALDPELRKALLNRTKQVLKLGIAVFLVLSTGFFTPGVSDAHDTGTRYLKAVDAYQKGEFKAAAAAFEKIAQQPVKSGELYFNTGNAYLKAGELGKAVLWYERAKKYIPRDADLRFNMTYAQNRVKDKRETGSLDMVELIFFWQAYLPAGSLKLAAVIFSFAFFGWAAARLVRRRKILSSAGTVLVVIFGITLAAALLDFYRDSRMPAAVIIPEEVSVRSGLTEAATELFVLHSGTKVRVDRERAHHLLIRFSDEKIGWVKKSDADII